MRKKTREDKERKMCKYGEEREGKVGIVEIRREILGEEVKERSRMRHEEEKEVQRV